MKNPRKSSARKPRRERRLSIRAVRREAPDVQKLGRALIELAIAEAEAEAQQGHAAQPTSRTEKDSPGDANVS